MWREKTTHLKFKIVFICDLVSIVLRVFGAESVIHIVVGFYTLRNTTVVYKLKNEWKDALPEKLWTTELVLKV